MGEDHWVSETGAVQRVSREGAGFVYVGSVAGRSEAFYSLEEMSEWFSTQLLDQADPIWDYLHAIAMEEASNERG
jgi:hypothetical protein